MNACSVLLNFTMLSVLPHFSSSTFFSFFPHIAINAEKPIRLGKPTFLYIKLLCLGLLIPRRNYPGTQIKVRPTSYLHPEFYLAVFKYFESHGK